MTFRAVLFHQTGMTQNWTATWIIASALLISAAGVLVWRKKKRSFVPVGKIKKLFFYPVKSLKAVEVEHGICTKLGFVVNGVLDRSFMVVDGNGKLVSQREAPTLVLLTPKINGKNLSIITPSGQELVVEIKDSSTEKDKIIHCLVQGDSIDGIDCGDEAALFFQSYLQLPDLRMVQHVPTLPERKYLKNHPFYKRMKKEHPVGYQDLVAIHLVSQASVDDVNSHLADSQVSELNFRPNVFVEDCQPFDEDSWKYVKFQSEAELQQLQPTTRCILTTNDPHTGIITKKEPLVAMRKFRIPKSPDMVKNIGSLPCMGVGFAVLKPGPIYIGEDIYADVGQKHEMIKK
ncbi:hypothetical protein JTE90_005454 [Oedothorax gibbosus]|uniref:MOSC domain-containing protein n=1 Tax=Oedothorax gibbosus TaxID=931172 RepID=A0AAV6U5L9_9ARAC|nr:hypothetical protein JTE90_005454 [Oedothorax gibbosus]